MNKRRTPIRLKDACFYFETGCWPEMEYSVNVQVLREIEYMVNTYQLKPKVYLAYDRMAYFASEHKGCLLYTSTAEFVAELSGTGVFHIAEGWNYP